MGDLGVDRSSIVICRFSCIKFQNLFEHTNIFFVSTKTHIHSEFCILPYVNIDLLYGKKKAPFKKTNKDKYFISNFPFNLAEIYLSTLLKARKHSSWKYIDFEDAIYFEIPAIC